MLENLHKKRTGRFPEHPPKRFTDKIYHRKINDRRPILTRLTDKLQAKEVVGEYGIPILHVGDEYNSYPFIAKPNNYSGQTARIENQQQWDKFRNRWEVLRRKTYGQSKGEWAYKNIEPQLIIEPVIKDFWDMKCYVFNGNVEAFYVCGKGNRRPEQNGVSYFWPDGTFIDVRHNGHPNPFRKVLFDFEQALKVAEQVTPDIDFVRTDLMIADKIYVTEFTLYPGSGCIKFEPDSFDYELGEFWELETKMTAV